MYMPIVSQKISSPLLRSCTSAIGYASLANIENSKKVHMAARKSYTDALHHTSATWNRLVVQKTPDQNPTFKREQAKILLAGVMLLSVFEVCPTFNPPYATLSK